MVTNNSANNATAASGKILQGQGVGTASAFSTATYPATAGTSGKVLISDGTNIVSSTPTYPNASATSGKVIISDGTNFVASTPTFPNASASSGKFIRSDGTNWIASTPTLPTTAGTASTLLRSDGTNWVNTSAAKISSSDIYTNTAQPTSAYYFTSSASNVTGDGTTYTPLFPTTLINQGSNFNTGTGVFTAPVTGNYAFTCTLSLDGITAAHASSVLYISAGGSNYYANALNLFPLIDPTQGTVTISIHGIVPLTASSTANFYVVVSGGTKTVSITGAGGFGPISLFTITLIN